MPARSLLGIEPLEPREIERLLSLARKFEKKRPGPVLHDRRIALLFYETSTRTRISFEIAAKALGASTITVLATGSSIEKGESLLDTGYTLQSLNVAGIVIRHPNSGAAWTLARAIDIPVINAGDGMHEHPSQALLDAFTMLKHRRTLKGAHVLIVGDVFHSRVARSNTHLLRKLGADVTLCGPPALLPEAAAGLAPGVRIERDFDRAIPTADFIMMLRVQRERLTGLALDIPDYIARYQLHLPRLELAPAHALVMHPGPIIRGMELTGDVADHPRSLILEQVNSGLVVRQAILADLVGGRQ